MVPGFVLFVLVSTGIPSGPTASSDLSAPGFTHQELIRIDRDFGKAHWQLAVDGWVAETPAGRVEEMRLWWVNTDDADRRKPLSRALSRHVNFAFTRRPDGAVDIRLAGDGKEYRFVVDRDRDGRLAAFADVELADGSAVRLCRVDHGRLIARRVLGVPVGVEALGVRCTDRSGTEHDATVPYRPME